MWKTRKQCNRYAVIRSTLTLHTSSQHRAKPSVNQGAGPHNNRAVRATAAVEYDRLIQLGAVASNRALNSLPGS
jgi:hypothetical protein